MTRAEYLERAFEALNAGRISEETYDVMIMNIEAFCEDTEEY